MLENFQNTGHNQLYVHMRGECSHAWRVVLKRMASWERASRVLTRMASCQRASRVLTHMASCQRASRVLTHIASCQRASRVQ